MKYAWLFILLWICQSAIGQESQDNNTRFDDARLYYKREQHGGIVAHTHGLGLSYRQGIRQGAFNMLLFGGELVSMKHPKEHKTFNPHFDDSKGFVYGKKNAFALARGLVGRQRILHSKESQKGVRISTVYMGGLNLGLLKPVYLEIATPSVLSVERVITTERYNESIHSSDKIYGRASVFNGFNEISPIAGLHGRVAVNFEYAPLDEMIRALEVGASLDAFLKPVPIMALIDNKQFFLTFYLNYQMGKKSY